MALWNGVVMSGFYPDGCTQATHDRYYGQYDGECFDCQQRPCECDDMIEEIPDELYDLWVEQSELFAPPNVVHDGGVE